MKYLAGFVCVLALGVMPLVGCSDSEGTGGSGGMGGEGGTDGGGIACETVDDCPEADLCTQRVECINRLCFNMPRNCDDFSDCTVNTCDPAVGCEETTVADETPCAGGVCQAGQCALSGTVQPCTEQGIRNALAVGGGPYTFDCPGPTTAAAYTMFEATAEVILDGGGNLTVDGVDFFVRGVPVELRGFGFDGPSIIGTQGVLTFVDSTIGHGTQIYYDDKGVSGVAVIVVNSTLSGGIFCGGDSTLIMTNSTVAGGNIGCRANATIINSTISNSIIRLGAAGTIINSTISGGECLFGGPPAEPHTIANSVVEGLCCTDVISNGYNIESPGDTCGFDQTGDQPGVTAEELNLGPLADNDGPTMTRLPGGGEYGDGSFAIDQIPEADCEVDTDQRGEARPVVIAGPESCDVGSVEVQP
jgi:hypothetical protein